MANQRDRCHLKRRPAHVHSLDADPATALRAILVWSRLHGFVSLESAGNYASMGIDPGQVFEIQLATLTA
jgi:hypothetical protein